MAAFRLFKVVFGFVLVLILSCSADSGDDSNFEEVSGEQFHLSIQIIPQGSGVVYPHSGNYNKGQELTVRAIPNEGYSFSHWTGEVTSIEHTHLIYMDSDKSLTAVFTESETKLNDQR